MSKSIVPTIITFIGFEEYRSKDWEKKIRTEFEKDLSNGVEAAYQQLVTNHFFAKKSSRPRDTSGNTRPYIEVSSSGCLLTQKLHKTLEKIDFDAEIRITNNLTYIDFRSKK